ncbi:MAG: hypothetical protein GWP19_03215 [Planctomycetia bacterium]|nr:hypothetical protein [Planctomycetia bacterium]
MSAIDKGWITIHRKLQNHWLWQEKPFSIGQAWIDILLECNHEENEISIKNNVFIVKRGESLNSLKTWAKRWGWNVSATRRFLKKLQKAKNIDTVSETVTTRLTVCNYDIYQTRRNANETQMKRKRNASETQVTPDNNDNNETMITKRTYSASTKKFTKPIKTELDDYCKKMKYGVNTERFLSHYTSNGWKVGKNPMKSWEAALKTWHLKNLEDRGETFKKQREVKYYVYFCYHCNNNIYKKELGNYRCEKNDCQVETRGSVEDNNYEEIGAKLHHTDTIYKEIS